MYAACIAARRSVSAVSAESVEGGAWVAGGASDSHIRRRRANTGPEVRTERDQARSRPRRKAERYRVGRCPHLGRSRRPQCPEAEAPDPERCRRRFLARRVWEAARWDREPSRRRPRLAASVRTSLDLSTIPPTFSACRARGVKRPNQVQCLCGLPRRNIAKGSSHLGCPQGGEKSWPAPDRAPRRTPLPQAAHLEHRGEHRVRSAVTLGPFDTRSQADLRLA